jgi:hypothetical protein
MPSNLTQARLVETDVALQRSAAANKAWALAQGTYALFLDDDDWIAPHHVSTLVDALRNAPGFDVAYSRTQVVEPDQPASDDVVMGLPFDGLRLLAGNWMPLHSVLFSLRLRDLGCRFDEKLALYEDWDFWLQAAQHSDFLYVPVVSAFYRIHDSSGVHDQVRFRGDAFGMVYDKWRRLWSQEQLSEMMYRVWQHEDLSKTSQSSKEEALQAGDVTAVEQRLPLAYARMADVEIEVAFATLFAEDLARLPLSGDAARIAYDLGLLSPDFLRLSASRHAPQDLRGKFLAGLAQGRLQGLAPPDSMARALAPAFDGSEVPLSADARLLLAQNRIGEALFLAMARVEVGLHGEMSKLTEGLVLLRTLGLEETARATALQLMLLERRG